MPIRPLSKFQVITEPVCWGPKCQTDVSEVDCTSTGVCEQGSIQRRDCRGLTLDDFCDPAIGIAPVLATILATYNLERTYRAEQVSDSFCFWYMPKWTSRQFGNALHKSCISLCLTTPSGGLGADVTWQRNTWQLSSCSCPSTEQLCGKV